MDEANSDRQPGLTQQMKKVGEGVLQLVASACLGAARQVVPFTGSPSSAAEIFRKSWMSLATDELKTMEDIIFEQFMDRFLGTTDPETCPPVRTMREAAERLRVDIRAMPRQLGEFQWKIDQATTLSTAYQDFAQYAQQFDQQTFPWELYDCILTALEPEERTRNALLTADRSGESSPNEEALANPGVFLKPITRTSLSILIAIHTIHHCLQE